MEEKFPGENKLKLLAGATVAILSANVLLAGLRIYSSFNVSTMIEDSSRRINNINGRLDKINDQLSVFEYVNTYSSSATNEQYPGLDFELDHPQTGVVGFAATLYDSLENPLYKKTELFPSLSDRVYFYVPGDVMENMDFGESVKLEVRVGLYDRSVYAVNHCFMVHASKTTEKRFLPTSCNNFYSQESIILRSCE